MNDEDYQKLQDRKAARALQKKEGIKYTEALRRIREERTK